MRKTLFFLVLAAVIASVVVLANRTGASTQPQLPVAMIEEFDVGALGRIEPQSEVLQVNGSVCDGTAGRREAAGRCG